MDIFIVFQQLGNITVVFAAVSLILNTLPDRDKEIEKAWETLESGKAGRRTMQLTLNKLVKYKESLRFINLSGVFLEGVALGEVDLSGANLIGAILLRANLRGADLEGANLGGFNLEEANLEGAKFCKTNMPDGTINDSGCK